MELLTAVVEIDGTTGVVVIAVFVIVFLLVAALGWIIVRKAAGTTTSDTATWRFSTNVPLPVSPTTFDRVAEAARKTASRPSLTSEQRQFVDGLRGTRKSLARGYRLGLILAGLGGLVLSALIYRDASDEEMILLPVGILVLLSLGVLLSGLVPSRTVDPIEPVDPELFRNVHVTVGTEPLMVRLDDATTRKAIELLERDMRPEDVARQVTPGFERLDESTKQQVIGAIAVLRR